MDFIVDKRCTHRTDEKTLHKEFPVFMCRNICVVHNVYIYSCVLSTMKHGLAYFCLKRIDHARQHAEVDTGQQNGTNRSDT